MIDLKLNPREGLQWKSFLPAFFAKRLKRKAWPQARPK